MKKNFENDYLNRKIEPERDLSEGSETSIADYEEFGEHSYADERGKFEFKLGHTNLTFEFSKPSKEELLVNEDSPMALQGIDLDTFQNSEEFKPYLEMVEAIRRIDSLVLENQEKKIDISEIFHEKPRIYFNISRNLMPDSGGHPDKAIFGLAEDPLTPNGLAVLFHEIGHYKNYKADENEYFERQEKIDKFNDVVNYSSVNIGEVDEEVGQALLKEERNAWATALNDLRPFMRDLKFEQEKIDKFVHHESLQMYCTLLRVIFNNK